MSDNIKGGMKHDAGKPDLTYASLELSILLARVREHGAKKYSRNNWMLGFPILRSLAACQRHIQKFIAGQDFDEESGLLELGHALCSLEHAINDYIHRPQNDDRPVKNTPVDLGLIDKKIGHLSSDRVGKDLISTIRADMAKQGMGQSGVETIVLPFNPPAGAVKTLRKLFKERQGDALAKKQLRRTLKGKN